MRDEELGSGAKSADSIAGSRKLERLPVRRESLESDAERGELADVLDVDEAGLGLEDGGGNDDVLLRGKRESSEETGGVEKRYLLGRLQACVQQARSASIPSEDGKQEGNAPLSFFSPT